MGACLSKQSGDDHFAKGASMEFSSSITSRKNSSRWNATPFLVVGSRNFSGLRDSEVHMLRKSWRITVANEPKFPQLLFANVFRTHPELKNSFQLEHMPEEQILAHPKFISHAANFQKFFQAIHDHLSNDEELTARAVYIGKQHAHMRIRDPIIFHSFYWILIARRAMDIILKNSQAWMGSKADSQRAISLETLDHLWQMVLLRVILEMNIAFYDTLLRSSTAAGSFMYDTPGTRNSALSMPRTANNGSHQSLEPPHSPTGRSGPVQAQNGPPRSPQLRAKGSLGSGSTWYHNQAASRQQPKHHHTRSSFTALPMQPAQTTTQQRSASMKPVMNHSENSLASGNDLIS